MDTGIGHTAIVGMVAGAIADKVRAALCRPLWDRRLDPHAAATEAGTAARVAGRYAPDRYFERGATAQVTSASLERRAIGSVVCRPRAFAESEAL